MLNRRSAIAAALLVGLTACQPAAPAGLSDADLAAIKALDDNFTTMAMAGDFAGLVKAFYTDDAVFMAPNAPAATGHAEIEALLRTFPPMSNFTIQSDEVVGVGDLAYSRNHYSLTMTPPGGAAFMDSGKSMVILRKQADGSWKFVRDMFNSDIPLPEPAKPAK
jgi:ketosteroid isomerase-like protein